MGRWTQIDTPQGRIGGWRADPADAPRGALVIVQEIFGVNAHIRSVAESFAIDGYLALAPAYFDPIEPRVELGYDDAGFALGRDLITRLGLDAAVDITASAADAIAGAGKVGCVGYCWGGTVALLAAMRLGLPSVSYYGARNAPFLTETPLAPVMFHFGERDASIPLKLVQQHRDLLPQMDVFTYPAGHGFNCDLRADYEPSSARLARGRTLDFFHRNLA
ncbi:dienelactone hydrolase family protein [Pseudoxanthomonas sp. LH2527]|uniref:dienelactone hydrolase family protein n=1 Tax=Pseudoxanthomonas sp. LH2527 TaxID=2923249 RepID=UPI001F134E47|nr:dienelactone hydrolase family protein [Pseudoxanthomonas sp. LH2527]MCH6483775.1 dienelactone hydrolase family protein [Pseudoxanthomonas sp. LH2527]